MSVRQNSWSVLILRDMNSGVRLAEGILLLFGLMNVILYGFCDQPQTAAATVTRENTKSLKFFVFNNGKLYI